jgi:hypothetical protein
MDSAASIPKISLTPVQAAASTGFSRSRIYEAIKAGALLARTDGKAIVVELDELTRWVRSLPIRHSTAS